MSRTGGSTEYDANWVKTQGTELGDFACQRIYGCFLVGPEDLDLLCAYIDGQGEHHKARTVPNEFLMFLK